MARTVITVNLSTEEKSDVDILAAILGYSISAYAARAIMDQVERDKAAFPKAYEINKKVQEEVRQTRSA